MRERLEPWWQAQRNHCCHGAEVVLRIMPSSYGIIILCERAQDKDDCGTQYKYAVKRVGVQRDGCLSTVEGDDAMENALRLPLTSSLPHDAEDAKHGAYRYARATLLPPLLSPGRPDVDMYHVSCPTTGSKSQLQY